MSNSAAFTQTTNIVPVQGVFDPEPTFALQYFVGPAGTPFLAPIDPVQSGLTITDSTVDSTPIGSSSPSTGVFTNIQTTTGQITDAPVSDTDIANKSYVDSVAQGLNVKAACLYTTTNNITLSGLAVQAGGDWASTLTAGDRILVKNQSLSQYNGIYAASSTGWVRTADMNVWSEVPSAFTFIESGATLANTGWVCTATPSGTINVTAIPWSQFSGVGTYTAGNGLQLIANQFSVKLNGTTLDSSSSGLKISDTYPGQTSITTLGTVVTGTWNANAVDVLHGGTGATTLTGYVKGNGTSAFTASTTVPTTDLSGTISNAQLANSTISGVSLGSNLANLTFSTGITATASTYNGGTAVTISNAAPMVYPGAGIPLSTGSAWGTSYSTSGSGNVALTTGASLTHPTITDYTVYTPTTAPAYAEGRVFYDSAAHTLNYYNDNSQMSVNIAQEQIVRVHNISGAEIANGVAVYMTGSTGDSPTIDLAIANNEAKSYALGITTTTIPNGSFGYVTVNGLVNGIDTDHFADGSILYLSPTTPGAFTTTQPSSPNYVTELGIVVKGNPSTGIVLVSVAYQSVDSTNIVGQVAIAQGGTNGTATPTAGAVSYGTGTAYAFTAAGVSGQVLTSNGSSAPTWTTPTAYATVTDDTTTASTRYPLFANQTTGNLSTEYTSSTKLQYVPSTGIFTATGFSGSGSGLTSLPAGQLTGTIPGTVLGNSTVYIGTTAIALNRASASQSLTGVSIDGSAGSASTATTATNANNVAVTDNTSTNSDYYVTYVTNSTGNLPITVASTKFKFNPSSGVLTATGGTGGGTF